jgi:hypothetical protein
MPYQCSGQGRLDSGSGKILDDSVRFALNSDGNSRIDGQ